MTDPRLKQLNGTSRRNFLRWSATVAEVSTLSLAEDAP